jgi:hypothetical protein
VKILFEINFSGKVHMVAPLTWLGYLTGALCCVCAFLNILRFIPLFGYYGVENEVLDLCVNHCNTDLVPAC